MPPVQTGSYAVGAKAPGLVRAQSGPRVTTVATGLNVPWDIAFLPDGRALVTERAGRVRLLSAEGRLQDRPVASIPVRQIGEGGLLGVAVDPEFAQNRFVYLYRTTSNDIEIGRYRLTEDGGLSEQATVARGITVGAIHDSGRLHFGPDRRLYFTTGDAGRPRLAQRRGSLNGKMLRLDPAEYRGRAVRNVALLRGRLGRVRTVVEAPDGTLYALTSNRDGRGSPRAGDDRIVRIVPPRR